jgi:sugar phosphate isomerase/epimerase
MFDAWAPALQGLDIARAAQKLGALTVHTTVANYSVRPQFRYLPSMVNYEKMPPRAQAVPMHEGFIDYAAFLKAMTESGFHGTVAYEMCSPLLGGATLENLDRHAGSFLDYMRTRCEAGRPAQASAAPRDVA